MYFMKREENDVLTDLVPPTDLSYPFCSIVYHFLDGIRFYISKVWSNKNSLLSFRYKSIIIFSWWLSQKIFCVSLLLVCFYTRQHVVNIKQEPNNIKSCWGYWPTVDDGRCFGQHHNVSTSHGGRKARRPKVQVAATALQEWGYKLSRKMSINIFLLFDDMYILSPST